MARLTLIGFYFGAALAFAAGACCTGSFVASQNGDVITAWAAFLVSLVMFAVSPAGPWILSKDFTLWLAGAALLAAVACPAISTAADCRQFFYQRQAVAYVAQAVVYPQVYYQAGRDIEAESLAEKVARLVDKKLEMRQQQRQQVTARPQQSVTAQHCAKCHSGATPKGGLTFDGSTPIDGRHTTAALRQIRDEAMPKDHKLPPGAAAAIMNELLNLEAEPVQPVVPRNMGQDPGNDLPTPPPDDGGLR